MNTLVGYSISVMYILSIRLSNSHVYDAHILYVFTVTHFQGSEYMRGCGERVKDVASGNLDLK